MGNYSWCTSDTKKSIPCIYDGYQGAPETVYLLNPFGPHYKEDWMPYTDVTVNVGKLPFLESAIDTTNNGNGIIDFLVQNGFGELTEKAIPSGFCMFPVFRFNEAKLREIDNATFEQYASLVGPRKDIESQIAKANEIKASQAPSKCEKSQSEHEL